MTWCRWFGGRLRSRGLAVEAWRPRESEELWRGLHFWVALTGIGVGVGDAMDEGLEGGGGAEIVEAGVVAEVDDPVGAGLEGAVEEELGLLAVAGGEPGGGEVVVGEGCAVRTLVGAGEVIDGFGAVAEAGEFVVDKDGGDGAVGLNFAGEGEVVEGFLVELHLAEDHAEELVGGDEVGIEFEDAIALVNGLVVLAHKEVGPAERGLHAGRDGVEIGGVLHGGEAVFAASHAEEGEAVVLVGDGIVGIDGGGGVELAFGGGPVPVVVGVDGEEGDVGFGEGVIEGEGFEGGGLGARVRLIGRSEVIEALELIAAGEGGVGAGVVGVDEDGLVEEVDGLGE